MKRTSARVLVESLAAHGVDIVYGVPGESYLPILDAIRDTPSMRYIVCRHESGAGFMAVADGRMTGRPGTCMVSRGPGATNATIAIHTAEQGAAPCVFFIGQADRPDLGRGALQEMDYVKTFSDIAKLVIDVREPDLIGEVVARAYLVAASGTPGPVVVVLPEDVLFAASASPVVPPQRIPRAAPRADDLADALVRINAAERPVVLVGSALMPADSHLLQSFAETWGLPIVTGARHPHLFPNDHPHHAGNLGGRIAKHLLAAVRDSDLVLVLGERLSQSATQGYTFPKAPVPEQPMIHVYPDPERIGRIWHAELGIACDPASFLEAVLTTNPPATITQGRREWIGKLHKLDQSLRRYATVTANDGVVFGAVVAEIGKHLRRDAVVTCDAGRFSSFVFRHLSYDPQGWMLGAAQGCMGGSVPQAVAAGLRLPGQQVVGFNGDGGLLMTGAELATAVQYNVPVKLFIANNRSYGSIRAHQEGAFPGREMGTELINPDFVAMAESFGAIGMRIDSDSEIAPVVADAMAADRPVLVEVSSSLAWMDASFDAPMAV
jgi:acetolactate synthase I/II/III large subunit